MGAKNGQGFFQSSNEDFYEGNFEMDIMNGFGKMVEADGCYEGEFFEGLKSGKGRYEYSNTNIYDGYWKNGLRHGSGCFEFTNGYKYCGDWVDGIPNGKGQENYTDGSKFEGNFVHGVKNGQGKMVFNNGNNIYDGEWLDDKMHGHGKFVSRILDLQNSHDKFDSFCSDAYFNSDENSNDEGDYVYNGQWKNGLKDGFGVETYSTGNTFEGRWHQGTKSGHGKYIFCNGNIFEGEWTDNIFNGTGRFIKKDGTIEESN